MTAGPEKTSEYSITRYRSSRVEARPETLAITGEEDDMPTLELWLAELDALAAAEGCETPYTQQTGAECWREFYDDGVTPAEAWADEKSYGAEDCE